MAKSLDGVLIKKAHKQETFTESQIQELSLCMDTENGYEYFCRNYFYIQHPVKGKLLFDPYDYQVRLLHSYHDHRFNINMLPRQTGKTTCAAGYLLWFAMFHPDQTVLVAAHKYTGAQEIMQRIRYAYEDCPDHIRCGVTNYNKGSIEFDNGSRIVSATTTGNTGRGMSISLLYCDEFAFVQPNIAEEFWTSISPTLATGGRAIITSTPNSDEDTFAIIWKEANKRFDDHGDETDVGTNGFHSFTCHWSEHPDRDDAWKDVEMGRIGEERFRREYGCEFLVYDETLINSICLAGMQGTDPMLKMGQVRWYKKPSDDMIYAVSLDPALGTGGNYAAIQVLELPSMIQVGEWQHNTTPVEGQIRILRDINRYIAESCSKMNGSNLYWSVENNTVGEAALVVIKNIGEENIPGLFIAEPMRKGHVRKFRKGFNTTHNSKISACSRLKHLIETNKLKVNSKALISELKAFIANGVTFKAKVGETDDLVSAMLLAIRMSSVLADWDSRVFDVMTGRLEEDGEDWEPPMPIFVSSQF
jgi:Terminase large subunit, T4likevirus-type, N-terminal/Terminase RNaseH-like domain